MIHTNRCRISNIKDNDYEDVRKLYFNKKVREFLGGIVDKEKYDDNFKNMMDANDNSLYWVIRHIDTNEFVGLVSIDKHHDDLNTELSYQFIPEWWGKGYAEEVIKKVINYAFKNLKLKKIIAETQSANIASCKLLKKVGMDIEQSVQRFGCQQYIFSISNYDC